jgi:cyclohexyl-isocyanide hydratase
MKIQMLVYPGMTLLDLVGPLQIWASWPKAEFQFVWKRAENVATDSTLAIAANTAFADAWKTPDILFAPGGAGPTFQLLLDEETIDFMAERGANAGWVTSVCSGSHLLGAAGLLRGYRATSHWFARPSLALFGAEVTNDRFVIDRNRATGGGVTAGVDFGLAVMAHILGEPTARVIQLLNEYAPQPPFRSGTPFEATEETLAEAKTRFGGDAGAQMMEAASRQAAARLHAQARGGRDAA